MFRVVSEADRLLNAEFPDSQFDAVLRALAEIARNAQEVFETLESDPEFAEADVHFILDPEIQNIEFALGTTLVVLQNYMTAVTSRTGLIIKGRAWREAGLDISGIGSNEIAMRARNSPRVRGTCMTYVEAIHHAANYYKHGEQSPFRWRDMRTDQKRTWIAVRKLGVSRYSNGTFRTIATSLGLEDYTQLVELRKHVSHWRDNIRTELRRQGRADGCW